MDSYGSVHGIEGPPAERPDERQTRTPSTICSQDEGSAPAHDEEVHRRISIWRSWATARHPELRRHGRVRVRCLRGYGGAATDADRFADLCSGLRRVRPRHSMTVAIGGLFALGRYADSPNLPTQIAANAHFVPDPPTAYPRVRH